MTGRRRRLQETNRVQERLVSGNIDELYGCDEMKNLQNAESSTASGTLEKKHRGPTLVLEIWKRKSQVHVEYDCKGHAIGPSNNVKELVTFIGCLARSYDISPIDKVTWREVSDEDKERGWGQIMDEADKNHKNRSKLWIMHTLCRTSIPQKRKMMIASGDYEDPDRADVFVESYKRKDKTIHPSPRETVEAVQKAKEIACASIGDSQCSGSYDILSQVLGKDRHGRLRAFGIHATATNTWGRDNSSNTTSRSEVNSMKEELEAEQQRSKEVESKLQSDLEAQKTRSHELEEMLKANMEALENRQAAFQELLSRMSQSI